jgi:hypothetical protein
MGAPLHFKALMRKNFILWRRSCCSSCMEICCPMILFLFILMLRGVIYYEEMEPTSYWHEARSIYLPEQFYEEDLSHSFLDGDGDDKKMFMAQIL